MLENRGEGGRGVGYGYRPGGKCFVARDDGLDGEHGKSVRGLVVIMRKKQMKDFR